MDSTAILRVGMAFYTKILLCASPYGVKASDDFTVVIYQESRRPLTQYVPSAQSMGQGQNSFQGDYVSQDLGSGLVSVITSSCGEWYECIHGGCH